mmetsp:Transcript_95406/g.269885  ORF Transcript_95406/g.269885 Transcript_95406/m.269885 type:complete len:240 (-) Transcript_95406:1345-2064(-)
MTAKASDNGARRTRGEIGEKRPRCTGTDAGNRHVLALGKTGEQVSGRGREGKGGEGKGRERGTDAGASYKKTQKREPRSPLPEGQKTAQIPAALGCSACAPRSACERGQPPPHLLHPPALQARRATCAAAGREPARDGREERQLRGEGARARVTPPWRWTSASPPTPGRTPPGSSCPGPGGRPSPRRPSDRCGGPARSSSRNPCRRRRRRASGRRAPGSSTTPPPGTAASTSAQRSPSA